jgi:hypothetical protein
VVALQSQVELKRKYLFELVAGKLLRGDTLKKGCCGVKSLQASV